MAGRPPAGPDQPDKHARRTPNPAHRCVPDADTARAGAGEPSLTAASARPRGEVATATGHTACPNPTANPAGARGGPQRAPPTVARVCASAAARPRDCDGHRRPARHRRGTGRRGERCTAEGRPGHRGDRRREPTGPPGPGLPRTSTEAAPQAEAARDGRVAQPRPAGPAEHPGPPHCRVAAVLPWRLRLPVPRRPCGAAQHVDPGPGRRPGRQRLRLRLGSRPRRGGQRHRDPGGHQRLRTDRPRDPDEVRPTRGPQRLLRAHRAGLRPRRRARPGRAADRRGRLWPSRLLLRPTPGDRCRRTRRAAVLPVHAADVERDVPAAAGVVPLTIAETAEELVPVDNGADNASPRDLVPVLGDRYGEHESPPFDDLECCVALDGCAYCGGADMLDVDARPDRRLTVTQCVAHGCDTGLLDQRHDLRRAEHGYVARTQRDGSVVIRHDVHDRSDESDVHTSILPARGVDLLAAQRTQDWAYSGPRMMLRSSWPSRVETMSTRVGATRGTSGAALVTLRSI